MLTCLLITAVLAADPGGAVVAAPPLHGKSAMRARQLATLQGLQPAEGVIFISPENWRVDISPDTIYLQSPRQGAPIRSGDEIAMWRFERAAKEQPLLKTPDLVGKTWTEASEAIKQSGLRLMNAAADRSRDETITDQYPRAGATAYTGTSVFLKTSSPPPSLRR